MPAGFSQFIGEVGTTAVATSAVALGVTVGGSEILIQNSHDSANRCIIGNATAQTIELNPGEWMVITVAQIAGLRARCASGTATLNWMTRE